MKIIDQQLNGVLLFEPTVFGDERGYFFESFRIDWFQTAELNINFVQDNESLSAKNILRGLHFQAPPYEQGKLVRVTAGAVLDVIVDIRKKSPTYGQHYKAILSEENKRVLWVPPGFAHGFLSLKDGTRFLYKCTNYYNQSSEGSLLWNDPDLNINWNVDTPLLSEKDQVSPTLNQLESPF